jgi:glycosyltransferase A (GT-A) superfamily protein (DUF2064 family)
MHHRKAIIDMIKYPRPGSVKNRLDRQTGMEKAAKLYREFVRILLETCHSTGFDVVITCHPDYPVSGYRE